LNPEYYQTYELTGDFMAERDKQESADFYNLALSKEISSAASRTNIENKLSKLNSDTGYRKKK
jgi:predicted negative regulator of RcsB-dependent stress response